MEKRLRWISTNGGPLVLVPRSALPVWRGDRGTSVWNEENFTDYGRAGQVEGFVGLMKCGQHQVLVFWDEPAETTWLPYQFAGGVIAKWTYAPDIESAEAALARLSQPEVVQALPWHGEKVFVQVADQSMLLFDAAIEGRNLKPADFIEIPVHPGTLEIRTAIYEPNEEISFVLHSIGTLNLA